jgi:hypothetical protein
MADGMSDDGFHYFRSWILGKGKAVYDLALSSPDELGAFGKPDDEFDNELLEYAAVEVLEKRGIADPTESLDASPDDVPVGEPWEEDDVYDLYPKLAKKFG